MSTRLFTQRTRIADLERPDFSEVPAKLEYFMTWWENEGRAKEYESYREYSYGMTILKRTAEERRYRLRLWYLREMKEYYNVSEPARPRDIFYEQRCKIIMFDSETIREIRRKRIDALRMLTPILNNYLDTYNNIVHLIQNVEINTMNKGADKGREALSHLRESITVADAIWPKLVQAEEEAAGAFDAWMQQREEDRGRLIEGDGES